MKILTLLTVKIKITSLINHYKIKYKQINKTKIKFPVK